MEKQPDWKGAQLIFNLGGRFKVDQIKFIMAGFMQSNTENFDVFLSKLYL